MNVNILDADIIAIDTMVCRWCYNSADWRIGTDGGDRYFCQDHADTFVTANPSPAVYVK